jgi:hypothetical protein
MIATLADFCEGLGLPATMVPEVARVLSDRESLALALHEEKMARLAGPAPGGERLPLLDGNDEVGRVEARIPLTDFFNLEQKHGEGCWQDDGFMRDYLKARPGCRVNTVSGRIVSGWVPGRKTVKKYG